MAFDPWSIREDFPILGREVHGRPLVYLDNAATAQKPRSVIDITSYLQANLNANIHRGVHFLSAECTRLYEEARALTAEFIGAADPKTIVFTSGATASANLVASSFGQRYVQKGDNVVLTEMEHHSNIVPWQLMCQRQGAQIRVIPVDDDGRLMVEKLPELIDGRTRIVAVTQSSNVLGSNPDLKSLIDVAHASNIPVLVDGCQGVVHGPTDVSGLDCDFYLFSGHKLYGPTGVGVLYAKKHWLEELPPWMGGGDMVDRVSFEKTTYAAVPLKFEAGTANYIGAVALGEAIKYITALDRGAVHAHEQALLHRAQQQLSGIEGLTIYGDTPDKCSIVSFNIEGLHHYDVGTILDQMGVAIRTGTHCAEPLMDRFGVTGMCRASFAMYNTEDEVDKLVEGVKKAIKMLK